jgi:hypothetical protein
MFITTLSTSEACVGKCSSKNFFVDSEMVANSVL